VKLTKLEIMGFKSFGDKVAIHFNEGVTMVEQGAWSGGFEGDAIPLTPKGERGEELPTFV